jgi:hypothetical protein
LARREQLLDAAERCLTEHELERNSPDTDRQRHQHEHEVFDQDRQRQDHGSERRKRVEARERRRDERGEREQQHDQPEQRVTHAMLERPAQAWAREALEPADHPDQAVDKPLLLRTVELDSLPPLREPDLIAPDDQLQREQDRDHLEHMGRARRGQRQRRHAEQEHEHHRERLLAEQLDQAAKRLELTPGPPALDPVADPLVARCGHSGAGCGRWTLHADVEVTPSRRRGGHALREDLG